MSAPFVDVVVPIHDLTRPVARAVASIVAGAPDVRVTVVAHEVPESPVEALVDGLAGDIRVVGFRDGLASSSGPFNHGLELATAEYVAIMGSDDLLEPGALATWIEHARAERPDVVVAGLRHQSGELLHTPLTRFRRRRRLDPVHDRLFYRTAPLGLLRRSALPDGPALDTAYPVGADLHLSTRLWTARLRVDFDPRHPRYVVGADARSRVTTTRRPLEQTLRSTLSLPEQPWIRDASHHVRRSLGVKLARVNLLNAVRARPEPRDWTDADVALARETLELVRGLAPGVLDPLSRAERRVLHAVATATSGEQICAAWAASGTASRLDRIATIGLRHNLDRESVLTRYVHYRLA
jgi:hypothetical protein